MTPDARPALPNFGLVLFAVWTDFRSAFQKIPSFVLVAFLINAATELIRTFFISDDLMGRVLNETLGVFSAFLIIPYEIALYRLILREEISTRYSFAIHTRRFQRFFLWSLAIWVIFAVVSLGLDFIPAADGVCFKCISGIFFLAASIFAAVRLILLFPAIAVDDPEANLATAWRRSRGHFWFVFRSLSVAFTPLIVGALAAKLLAVGAGYAADATDASVGWKTIQGIMGGAFETIFVTTMLVVVARVYDVVAQVRQDD